jgi:hypothetical protein
MTRMVIYLFVTLNREFWREELHFLKALPCPLTP